MDIATMKKQESMKSAKEESKSSEIDPYLKKMEFKGIIPRKLIVRQENTDSLNW